MCSVINPLEIRENEHIRNGYYCLLYTSFAGKLVKEMIDAVILFHDLGKGTPAFQKNKIDVYKRQV